MSPGNPWLQRVCCASILVFSSMSWAAELTLDIVDADHKPLADAVVALVPPYKPDFSEPVYSTMDQHRVRFSPQVLAVRTNTRVEFLNSDPIFHHVYSFSPVKRFELGLAAGERSDPVLFDQPGEVVLGCNIHDGMLAYIYVLDTEWFGVTGSNGRVRLTQLPPGDYQLVVRHPRLKRAVSERLTLSSNDKVKRLFMLPDLAPDPHQARAVGAGSDLAFLPTR